MPVLNKHRDRIPPGAIYIGRGSRWGNPYVIGKHGNRDEVCDQHEEYLASQIDSGTVSLNDLAQLHGKNLVCFCTPARCHGHTLEHAAAWAYNQLKEKP